MMHLIFDEKGDPTGTCYCYKDEDHIDPATGMVFMAGGMILPAMGGGNDGDA